MLLALYVYGSIFFGLLRLMAKSGTYGNCGCYDYNCLLVRLFAAVFDHKKYFASFHRTSHLMVGQDSTIPLPFLPPSHQACTIRISYSNMNYKIVKCQVIRVCMYVCVSVRMSEKRE